MTDIDTEVQTIPEEIVEEDQDLRGDTTSADHSYKSAKERRAEAYAALNQFRWEMCECPYGPQFSQAAYARAVGVAASTINRGVAAWQDVVDRDSVRDAQICNYGSVSHHVPDAAPAEGSGPTDEQVEKHAEGAKKATASELRVLAIDELAVRFGVAFDTMKSRTELIKDALARLGEYDVEGLSIEQVRPTLASIALQIHQEHKLREAHERSAQRWMASNLGIDVGQIQAAKVRQMVDRIERTAERKQISYEEAEVEVRQWDFARSEAERINNEIARKARLAVLDLKKAAAGMRLAAIDLGKALQRIDADSIPITDDEMELVRDDVEDAFRVLQQARAAVGGKSGIDWDKALEQLTQGDAA